MELEEELVDFNKDRTRAKKRRLDRIKEGKKESQKAFSHSETICPEEKRMRKRKGVRKVRHNDDVGQFSSYKKHCDIHV